MIRGLFSVLLLFVIASPSLCARVMPGASPSFNVVGYGAKGDGHTDDSNAFVKAWQDVCGANATHQGTPTLLIPKGKTFMLQPVSFQGPCKTATVNVQLQGTIIAPKSVESWNWTKRERGAWVRFTGISGLVMNGGGQIDGQGAPWWQKYSKHDQIDRPTALNFDGCQNLTLSTLTHINSPRNHISICSCNRTSISNLHIIAPGDSPNTDGIDISTSSNIIIANSTIETGDDCVAINSGSTVINITDVFCGPGHGISVGSLGRNGSYATVEEVHVQNCTFKGTQNGARIKTWMGGCGYARKITFEDIRLVDVDNPVIIDQHYYDLNYDSAAAKQAVRVSNVTYRNVAGTSACESAIRLNCDPAVGCTNVVIQNVNITSAAAGKKTYASCTNAHGTCSSTYPNVTCLSP